MTYLVQVTPEQRARIEKLADALESGEYTQGRNLLRRGNLSNSDEFCCLGVACEVYRKETGKGEWVRDSTSRQPAFQSETGTDSYGLLQEVAEWFGIPDRSTVRLRESGILVYAGSINDYGEDFKTIAALFRAVFVTKV